MSRFDIPTDRIPYLEGGMRDGRERLSDRLGQTKKARSLAPYRLAGYRYFFCGRLAGGMMLFMRRYSTIWP